MEQDQILQRVISSLGLTGNEVWKTGRSNSPELTSEQVVTAVYLTKSVPEASKSLGAGAQTINRVLAKTLVPLLGSATGGNNTWKLKLLQNACIKRCTRCNEYKEHSEFTTCRNTFDCLAENCIQCVQQKNAKFYSENKDTYHAQYIKEHREEYVARNALRKARKIQATPSWANLVAIKEVYPASHALYTSFIATKLAHEGVACIFLALRSAFLATYSSLCSFMY